MARVRFRSATANTAASRTNENKTDRIRWPPSSSSTKGAEISRTDESNEKLYGGEATESEALQDRFYRMSRMRVVLHSVFASLYRTPKLPAHRTRNTLMAIDSITPRGCQALSDASGCLKASGDRPAHRSPYSFATFPHTPLHRRVLIHLGVLEIFPGELLVGAELLIGLVLFGSTDVCLIVSRVRENVIRFSCPF